MKPSIPFPTDRASVAQSGPDRRVLVLGLCVLMAFLFCYALVLTGMVRQWWMISMYSYAFLIPVISGYLVWVRRAALYRVRPFPDTARGAVLIVSGLLLLVLGQAGSIVALQQISFMIMLPGVVLFLFGPAVLAVVGLPIAFLGFMIPMWDILTESLHLPFQQFSADLGVWLLRLVGIPVYQDGVFIHLPNISLEVARACSGVNYLIAVLATSIPLATIVLTDVRKRIVLVVLAMLVSALANGLRVALIGVLAYYDLSGDLHGPYHTLHGIFVSLIGYVVIFGGLWILSRGQQGTDSNMVLSAPSGGMWTIQWGQVHIAWSVLAGVFLLVGIFQYLDWSRPVPLRQNLSELSLESVGWIGRQVLPAEKIQGVDQSFSRVYRTVSGKEVTLSLWYFEAQSQGKELIGLATGKLHMEATRVRLNVGGHGHVEVNRRFDRDGDHKQVILFWYDVNGRILASPHAVKFYTVIDAVIRGWTNGALVWVAADLPSDDQPGREQAVAGLEEFVSQAYPVLGQYLPNPAE